MTSAAPPQTRRPLVSAGHWLSLPYVLFFLLFVSFPLIFSLVLIFYHWNIYTPMRWAGWANFERLFRDVEFFYAIRNTVVFLIIHIPLQIAAALGIALLLNQRIRCRGFFRAVFFLPVVVSGVVVTIIWQELYGYDTGLLNQLLLSLGLAKIPWLNSPQMAMPSIALMATWKNVGLYIVFFLIGLQQVPRALYEAADIDGASPFRKFTHVTFPALGNTMALVVVLSTIGGFSLFVEPMIMTSGGPMGSTLSAMLYIYKQAFYFQRMGYAAALGLIFALMVLVVVLLQRIFLERKGVE